MADGVRYILDKLAALFRRLEDTELFTKVTHFIALINHIHAYHTVLWSE
jgi:hypothetical protein